MEGEFKYRESAERTPLHQNPQSVYFYITSADSTTRALAILGRFLRTKRECNQKSGRVFPVTPGNPVVVTVRYLIIEDEKHKDYGIRTISEGHVLVSKGMTRNFPARVTFGETNVYFRKPTTLEYNIYQVLNDFFLYTVLDDGQVMKVQINLRLYGAEDQDQNEAANAEDAEEQIQCDPMKEELKVMGIRKSKSSSPHEPVLDPDDDEDDQGIESTNYQSKPISTTNTFDIEEFLSKRGEGDEAQDEQESDVLELTGSMKDLFLEIRTSSRSSGSISISSKSAEILVSKMEKIDGNLQNNMLILKERIQHLESENKCLREHYQQSMDDMKAQMEKMKEEFKAEIERLQAELQASYATQQNHIVTKKIKIDDIPLSSSQILAKKRSMPPKENQDLSSSRMSLFPQQSKENKPKFYQEVEEVGKEMEEEESDPKLHLEIPVKLVNETWRQKLDLLLLGKKESGSNCKLAYGIDEEIIDSFINKYQEEKQEEIFYFKVSTIDKIIRNKGTSQLRYDENYFSCKYIIAPVSIEEKKGKHYSLLIISNNGNWINGPYIIQAWSYDSKGFSEPKDATVKILKYLLDCKRKKHGSGEHFNTQISAKKIPVAKELSFNESAFHMLYHLKEFSLYKNKYIPSKKSLDLSRFRQDLYNMLLYRK